MWKESEVFQAKQTFYFEFLNGHLRLCECKSFGNKGRLVMKGLMNAAVEVFSATARKKRVGI